MTAETPTPLTDSLADCIGGYGHVYQLEQWYDLCCQFEIRCAELERERDQLKLALKEDIVKIRNAHKDYIDKLERENAEVMLTDQGRLRSKLVSYENQIAELRRDRERLLNTIKDAADAVSIEINPSNYDHEQVCELNRQTCYAMGILDAAIRDSRTGNEREASPPAAG